MLEQDSRHDIFLSHNSKDVAAARAIAQALREHGLKVFLADRHMPPGTEVNAALSDHLLRSATVAVLLGPQGLGPFQTMEKDLAIHRRNEIGTAFRVWLTMLPGGDAHRDLPPLDPIRRYSGYPFLSLDPHSPWFHYGVAQHVWAVRSALRAPDDPPLPAPEEPSGSKPGAISSDTTTATTRHPADRTPGALSSVDTGALTDFADAARKRGVVLLLGRRWRELVPGSAADETYRIGRHMIRAMGASLAARMHSNVLPAVDDIATCLQAMLGPNQLEDCLSELLAAPEQSPPSAEKPALSDYLGRMLALSGGGLRSGPPEQRVVLLSSGQGLLLEAMLIRYGHPFVRVVPRRGSSARLDVCTDLDALQAASGTVAAKPASEAATWVSRWLKRHVAQPALDVQSGLALLQQERPHVVLVKCMGSIDEDDSCVLTRAHVVQFADIHGRGGIGNYVVGALSERPVLIAGFRQLDGDFALLASLYLRRVLHQADARNPRLMAEAAFDDVVEGGDAAPGFFSDVLLASGAAVRHDALTSLGIRPVPLALPILLARLDVYR